MSMQYSGTGITFPDSSAQTTAPSGFGFKNRIINGAMMIDQRNAGASVTPSSTNYGSCDRWRADYSSGSKFSMQQNAGSVTLPTGFSNYLGMTSLAATSVAAGDFYMVGQSIEGLNVADLGWGTSGASAVTLSFKVYSSLTGTFGGALGNSGNNRSYPFSYTVSSANTWTSVSITIPGDTTGTWLTTNGIGIKLFFGLGVGSTYSATAGSWGAAQYFSCTGATSVVGTNGATFYITGVQLEKGSTATSFDYRPYGTELQLCQRYYASITGPSQTIYADYYSNNTLVINLTNPVQMRATPTAAVIGSFTTLNTSSSTPTFFLGNQTVSLQWGVPSAARTYAFNTSNSGYYLSSEL